MKFTRLATSAGESPAVPGNVNGITACHLASKDARGPVNGESSGEALQWQYRVSDAGEEADDDPHGAIQAIADDQAQE